MSVSHKCRHHCLIVVGGGELITAVTMVNLEELDLDLFVDILTCRYSSTGGAVLLELLPELNSSFNLLNCLS